MRYKQVFAFAIADHQQVNSLTAEKVEQFEVRILKSDGLVVVNIPVDAPWNATNKGTRLIDRLISLDSGKSLSRPGRAQIEFMSNSIEDLMPAEQRHQFFVQSLAGTSLTELRLTDELSAGLRHAQRDKPQKEERGLEAEWQERLRSLEQWICELLIENQQLRVGLEPTMTSERGDRDASNV
jgi:hypothetical protein